MYRPSSKRRVRYTLRYPAAVNRSNENYEEVK